VDRTLVERAQRGDMDAYEALVRASTPRLYLTAYRIVRDADAAEDATQQALVAAWRDLRSLRDPDRFEAWTYRLVVRACLTERRRSRRSGVREIRVEDVSLSTPSNAVDASDLRDQLDRALGALPDDQRAVVVLHHYVGLPLVEIAEILGAPAGTVRSRLHHAKRAMRAAIEAADRSTVVGGQPA
jgi:RNA polymerase sigma-70 factor, ECF subfamily